jgi:hypothetical protein
VYETKRQGALYRVFDFHPAGELFLMRVSRNEKKADERIKEVGGTKAARARSATDWQRKDPAQNLANAGRSAAPARGYDRAFDE